MLYSPTQTANGFPLEFLVISKTAFGSHKTDFYKEADENAARTCANAKRQCWVLYRKQGTELLELSSGGIGFAHAGIRKYAHATFVPANVTQPTRPGHR